MPLTPQEADQIADAVVVRLKHELGFIHGNGEDDKRWDRLAADIRYLGRWRATMDRVGQQSLGAVASAAAMAAAAAVWLYFTGRGGQ